MKNLILLLFIPLMSLQLYSKDEENYIDKDSLLYSSKTMKQLSNIVDSLNLKFKYCNFNQDFYSKYQTIGYLVEIDKNKINEAIKDMKNNISFEDFISKYPKCTVTKNILILKEKHTNYDNEEVVEIQHFDLNSDYGFSIESEDLSLYNKDFTNTWLFEHHKKTSYSEESLTAFYFPNNFTSIKLPKAYSEMIGYSDCLIDTTTTKMKENAKYGWVDLPENWQSLSLKEKKKLLDQMRSTNVIGQCSMDNSPRLHAMNIAILSAETANWPVFLKAHLDIMNDRFQRMTDGSYAWKHRKTYIKELEELNINVTDLILGIAFRIENPATNHYYGSIWRLGKALSETKNREEVENSILSVISNNELDDFNRLLFYFLYNHYNNHLLDEDLKTENKIKLNNALSTLPNSKDYILQLND